MPKLFDILDTPPQPSTPAQQIAGHWPNYALSVRTALIDAVTRMAEDCAKVGKAAIFAEMPPEVAKEFDALLPLVKQLWEAASDATKFPELSDKPTETAQLTQPQE